MKWAISYFSGYKETKTIEIEAPTASDALTMYDVNVRQSRIHPGSLGPLVGDVFEIAYVPVTK